MYWERNGHYIPLLVRPTVHGGPDADHLHRHESSGCFCKITWTSSLASFKSACVSLALGMIIDHKQVPGRSPQCMSTICRGGQNYFHCPFLQISPSLLRASRTARPRIKDVALSFADFYSKIVARMDMSRFWPVSDTPSVFIRLDST